MNHWQIKARNKASEEKRKGRKQGEAIVEWMRKQGDKQRKELIQEVGEVDKLSGEGD